ncbi:MULTISPECIES: MCE family protein [Mycobacterium]|uniref:MCE family protein n=1 Tax=Mycobacterium TaxID=1763 RepID=UPI002417DC23|nr:MULTISPECIES: MCE family protein [Mycobacterium]
MRRRCTAAAVLALSVATSASGCGWKGLNSIPLPGTVGQGPGAYTITAQMPDVTNIQQNSRVRVGDVTVGNVTKIERQGWHALLTMRIDGDVNLPANTTAKIGQTSLLGSLHVELASPDGSAPAGRLQEGSQIPLTSAGAYPSTEQTLAAASMLLNGGGIGQIQEITKAFSTAFAGREHDLRSLIQQLDTFIASANDQTDDIIAATEGFNNMMSQFASQKPVLDRALTTIPEALTVLKDQRNNLVEVLDRLGRFSSIAAGAVEESKEALIKEFSDLGPVLESLANAGPALTRSLSFLATFPWPKETLDKWVRGDYANLTAVIDMTLSRLDSSLFTGTRWEGDLTELEMQWGRTIGQMPSPYTAGNPLVVPYHLDQGP